MTRSDYTGQLGLRPPSGNTAGTCTPVQRTFVTGVQEDSGGFAQVPTPSPIVVPSGSPLVLPLSAGEVSGGATVDTFSGEIEFVVDALHKAACNVGLRKLGGGANVCRLVCEAKYGPGAFSAVPGGVFDLSLGGFASDELPPISFEAPLFSPSFVGSPGPVRFRWTVQETGGGGGPLVVYRGYVYGFQIQPVVTTATLENCESQAPPVECPTITETRVSVAGAPFVAYTGSTIIVGAGAPVTVVSTLSGPLPSAITASNPPGATYNPATPPGPSTPGGATITWAYLSPPGIVSVTAETATCEYDLGAVTDGTP